MNVQQETINALRILSAEEVENAKSGHPGLPLGSAPIVYTLFQNFMSFNPRDTFWDNRDRFVLSAGHGSALLYALLHLYGYNLTMEDLKKFRQWKSKTPGHPEYGHTQGVETTTGPLGQGLATAVGMAAAEAHLSARFNRQGFPIVDHYTYVLCGDGCLEEGVSYEACSFAGAHALGKLILFYDDNDITIEGDTACTFKENVGARFASQNWHVQHVNLLSSDDVDSLTNAVQTAKEHLDKPSVIICHTRIGAGSPLVGSQKCHGSPLGETNLQKTKKKLGYDYPPFTCSEEVYAHCKEAASRGQKAERAWKNLLKKYDEAYPSLAYEYRLLMSGKLPELKECKELFEFEKPMATRQTSSVVLNKLAPLVPSLIGGSADLAPSTLTEMKDTEKHHFGTFAPSSYEGRNIHFGIREHAMTAIANGMYLHGGLRPYSSTFFVFSDFCKPSIRLSALMDIPSIYVFTHDSVGVGEDGPTHEPIEQLVALRSIPNLKVFRPADGKETAYAWISALEGKHPTALVLSRQTLPQYDGSGEDALKGGYVLEDCEGTPDVLLLASGSEVELCVQAKKVLDEKGVKARVVSMPCMEEFEDQPETYRESVLPHDVKARVIVEAGSSYSWFKYQGEHGQLITLDHFGASAPAKELFKAFGFTSENVVEKALQSIADAK